MAPTDSTESFSPADVQLLAVPPGRVSKIWWLARSQLELATSRTQKTTLDAVYASLLDRKAQLWMAFLPDNNRILCSCVTDIQQWESGYITCRVLLVGGERIELWRHLIRQLEAYAMDEGAHALEVIGRKGWERIFRDDGFAHSETTLVKGLL